jgi:hypothetical protein
LHLYKLFRGFVLHLQKYYLSLPPKTIKTMKRISKGGRPRTDRSNAVTVRISDESQHILEGEHNKSELIDQMIQGKVAHIRCPHCGEVITIKTD